MELLEFTQMKQEQEALTELRVGRGKQAFLLCASFLLAASQIPSCGSADQDTDPGGAGSSAGDAPASGGTAGGAGAGRAGRGGGSPTGGASGTAGGSVGGAPNGGAVNGGVSPGGAGGGDGVAGGTPTGVPVAIARSAEAEASQITEDEVQSLVAEAVSLAGGLDFIKNDQTVVLKPNLVKTRVGGGLYGEDLSQTANGVTTDYRVVKAVAELVRQRNPDGRVIVLEGSVEDTSDAYRRLGYTSANFGSLVDEFIPLEGEDCAVRDTTGLVEAQSANGHTYWASQELVNADVVITLPVLKTHLHAGVTAGVKNIGIGMVPVSQYANGNSASDCTRSFTIINHDDPEELHQWIAEFYSIRPADFAVVDGLQGIQNGPSPDWVPGGDYDTDQMNMRLVMASRDTTALDVVATQIMQCDVEAIGYLALLDEWGIGTADPAEIDVVGVPVPDVAKPFVGPSFACP